MLITIIIFLVEVGHDLGLPKLAPDVIREVDSLAEGLSPTLVDVLVAGDVGLSFNSPHLFLTWCWWADTFMLESEVVVAITEEL